MEVRPRPGVYGLDVEQPADRAPAPRSTFKYARYFAAAASRPAAIYGQRCSPTSGRSRSGSALPDEHARVAAVDPPGPRHAPRAAAGGRHATWWPRRNDRGFDEFAGQARRGGGMVPVTRQVVLDGDTPVTAFAKLHRGPYGFLLESLEGGERWARYTFLATEPREVFRYRGRRCERWTPATGWARRRGRGHRPARPPGDGRCGGTRRWGCPGFRGSPAARSAISATTWCAPSSRLPDAPAGRPGAARRARDGGGHAARARQPVQSRHRHRERRGRRTAPTTRMPRAGLRRARRRGSTLAGAARRDPARVRPLDDRASRPLPPATSPYPDERSRRTCAGSRSTSPRATPSRRC